ncbi:hypothetical protein B0O79_3012 [Flavobacteriaceae bacterium MAR_2009_75]|nr:hypothetical protein B0O79_3012 [Flavobacteriaceae bacterium MAR_2009_75]
MYRDNYIFVDPNTLNLDHMLKHIAIPFLLIGLLVTTAAQAQVKIGDDPQTIDAASLLELQSSDKVLVITRVDSLQMMTIVPNRGAMVYNTTADCIYYYDGSQWNNLCSAMGEGGNLAADPLVNDISTIVITPTADGNNFEIAPNSINSEQIVNGGINGVDIQDGSIGQGKLQNNSVTQDKLSENSVGSFALDNDNINLSDFTNDEGFITNADIISNDFGNSITAGGDNGAFYDDSGLQAQITTNATNIAADGDTDDTNEIQSLELNNGNELSITGVAGFIPLPTPDGSDTNIENGTNTIVSGDGTLATPYAINITGVDTDDTNELQDLLYDEDTNILTLSNPASSTNQFDLNVLATQINSTATVTVSGDGSATNPYELTAVGGGGGSTEVVDGTTLTGTGSAANPFKIEPSATNGQFLTTNASGDVVWANVPATGTTPILSEVLAAGNGALNQQIKELLDPTAAQDAATKAYVDATVASGGSLADGSILVGGAGDVAFPQVLSGDATMDNAGVLTIQNDSITSLKIKDGTITLEDLSDMGANDNDILRWDDATISWQVEAAPGDPIGATNAIFFADTDGTLTTTDENAFANDDGGLLWDPEGRVVNASNKYGALYIGLDGGVPSDAAKVHISDNFPGVGYALQLQNQNASGAGRATGILFSTETVGSYGKGALVYERQESWARGDFHFLQNETFGTGTDINPDLNDKAFTIQNDKDIVLYGGIEIDGLGTGTAGQVLTSTGAGVEWGTGGGTITTDGSTITGNGTDVANAISLADNAVSTIKLQDDAVNTVKIIDDAITSAKIMDGEVQTADILNGTILAVDLADMGAANDQVLKWNGTAWAPANDAGGVAYTAGTGLTLSGANAFSVDNLAGEVTGPTTATVIAANTINSAKIIDGEVESADIANGTILAEDFADMGATNDQVLKWNGTAWAPAADAGGVAYTAGAGLTLSGTNEFSVDDLAGEITGPTTATVIAENSINSAKILDGEVQTADILNGTILAEDLADMGAANDQVLKWNGTAWAPAADAGGVAYTAGAGLTLSGANAFSVDNLAGEVTGPTTATVIANDAITTAKIQDGQVQTNDIADDNVSVEKIAQGTNGQILTTSGTDVVWADAQNFAESDLTQTADRIYDLDGNDLSFDTGGGNIGIGDLPGAPQSQLDVNGSIRSRAGFNATEGSAGDPGYGFFTDGDTDTGMFRDSEDNLGFSTGGTEVVRIDDLQNVGIGLTANANRKLHVAGNVQFDGEVWTGATQVHPDYVFQKYFNGYSNLKEDYTFMNLSEIESFVLKHNHLPGIQSAEEIHKEGMYNITKMSTLHLEKIEELFLHTIEQEKKIKQLKAEKEAMVDEIKAMKKDLEEIKALLQK